MNGCEANSVFALKCLMRERPMQLLSVSLFFMMFFSAYLLVVFESRLDEASGMNLSSYSNAMWCVIVTMTTVGYGDFFPRTHMGRLIGIMICMWGVLVVSLLVVTVSNKLLMDTPEEKSYTLLERVIQKEEMQKDAARVLISAFRNRQ